MGDFINQKMYKNTSVLANAMSDIDEKVREIKEVEKGINRLYDMIKELHSIISSQNNVVDSIAQKVDEIKDHVDKTITTTEEAKNLYMSAKEVSSLERLHFVCHRAGRGNYRNKLDAGIIHREIDLHFNLN